MLRSALLLVSCLSLLTASAQAQPAPLRPDAATLKHWQSRKFGMFIHFGLYSTLGGVWRGKNYGGNYSEQIQSDAHIPEAEYAALAKNFRPDRWDPDAVVALARAAGMQFIVLTSKHHDGFNLFETHQTDFNVVDGSPYRRDIVKGLAEACARAHMPFGVYYSTIDWHYGDIPDERNDNRISPAHEDFNARQLEELVTGYGPLTEIWFDMGHPTKLQSAHFADVVHKHQPNCLVSGRLWNSQGDFLEMGDDEIPDYILDEPWESPASIFKDTWGYRSWQKRTDLEEKRREQILRLVKVVSQGGNYILNIGPKGDGSVVPYEADVLRGMGAWLKTNGVAIYGTQPQPFHSLDFGRATVKGNQLFLFVEKRPAQDELILPGMSNTISKAYWLHDPGHPLSVTKSSSGDPAIRMPQAAGFLPVVAVEFKGPLNVRERRLEARQDGSLVLLPDKAEHFYNQNGEGYYDPPTLRKQQWVFPAPRAGRYALKLETAPGKFARALDVTVNGTVYSVLVYGDDKAAASVGEVELATDRNTIVTVEPGAPAERGTVLDAALKQIVLQPVASH